MSAISLGDLDRATNVTVNVPGATTTMLDTDQKVRAAEELFDAAYKKGRHATFAVVTWVGYHAPDLLEVPALARAESGGAELASFIDGVVEGRGGTPPASFTVAAHSYGSTTAAEALVRTQHRVTSFVSYGSVGFRDGTTPQNLHADAVYATLSPHDTTAPPGNFFSQFARDDPIGIDGVKVFSSAAGDGTLAVTGHDMYPEKAPGQVGYLSEKSTSLDRIATIVATGKPR